MFNRIWINHPFLILNSWIKGREQRYVVGRDIVIFIGFNKEGRFRLWIFFFVKANQPIWFTCIVTSKGIGRQTIWVMIIETKELVVNDIALLHTANNKVISRKLAGKIDGSMKAKVRDGVWERKRWNGCHEREEWCR